MPGVAVAVAGVADPGPALCGPRAFSAYDTSSLTSTSLQQQP